MAELGKKVNGMVTKALQPAPVPVDPPHKSSREYKAIWYSIVQDFPADYFRQSDFHVLDQFCTLTLEERRMTQRIEEEGMLVDDGLGKLVPNPMYKVRTMAHRQLNVLRAALRIQPSARLAASYNPASPKKVKAVTIDQDEAIPWIPPLAHSK